MKPGLKKEFPKSLPRHGEASNPRPNPLQGQNRVPNEYIFRLHKASSKSDLQSALAKEALQVRKIEPINQSTYLVVLVRDPGPARIAKMASAYQAILSAQPNFIYKAY